MIRRWVMRWFHLVPAEQHQELNEHYKRLWLCYCRSEMDRKAIEEDSRFWEAKVQDCKHSHWQYVLADALRKASNA